MRYSPRALCLTFCTTLSLTLSLAAHPILPDGSYDEAIPTPASVLGFEIGTRHLHHFQLVEYCRALAVASDRVELTEYARSHGGRPLLLLTISAPSNLERINVIQRAQRRLADPEHSEDLDLATMPAVMYLGYSVHGNEPSGGNVAPLVAYYLAASQDPEVAMLLDRSVLLLDPCLNPDGFQRFADWSNRHRGRRPRSDSQDLEHREAWPGGRTNYYWFDLNRDWLPAQHPESRGRLEVFHAWKPNVVLDFHEMGSNSTYFFQPGIPARNHPLTPETTFELTRRFADFHSQAFDERGVLYFTEERFDDFYMGKGSTYPDLHGAVGILFEQASSRGMVQDTRHGTLEFEDTVHNQFTTSLSSLAALLELRRPLLEWQRDFYRQALEAGRQADTQAYLVQAPHDPARLDLFAQLLARHDIRTVRLAEPVEVDGITFEPQTSLAIPTAQPEYLFLLSLFERRTDFEENVFYDVSTWQLPDAFGLESAEWNGEPTLPLQIDAPTGDRPRLDHAALYVFDWRGMHAARTAYRLLEQGHDVYVARDPIEVLATDGSSQSFPPGSFFARTGPTSRSPALRRTARRAVAAGLRVVACASARTPDGPDLGSDRMIKMELPRVALLVGSGVRSYEAGEVWHLFDQRFEIPLTLLDVRSLASTDLDRYTHLILVGGSYPSDRSAQLHRWLSGGGTIVAYAGATGFLESLDGVGTLRMSNPDRDTSTSPLRNRQPYRDADTASALRLVSGAILQTEVDVTHPLGYGLPETLPVFRNHTTYLAPSANIYANPLVYSEQPLLSGYMSEDNRRRVGDSASAVVRRVGLGRLILLAENPNFRAFWYGTNRLLMNGIMMSDAIR